MADPLTYRPAPGAIPDEPGVYRFRDHTGRVIYVGKAKSLRSRLSSYFQDLSALHQRTQAMVQAASSVDWVVVTSEVEALQLEYTWIKEFDPRFNVRYRDDKSYPYLAVTWSAEYPRALVVRGAKRKGTRYFGPYPQVWAIRDSLDLLLRVFPVRTCSDSVFRTAARSNRPCLLGDIGKCAAPCVGRVSADEHREIAAELMAFLGGRSSGVIRSLREDMFEAAESLDYERAARRRDDLAAIEKVLERSAVVLGDGANVDVFGIAQDELEAAVGVFHVRGGRIRGQRTFFVEKVEDITGGDIVARLLMDLYHGDDAPPPELLVPELPSDGAVLTEWLAGQGRKVSIRVPARGPKAALMETVAANAAGELVRHKASRVGDLTRRGQALAELGEALELETAPLRIECVDISNLQGTDVVASLVVFEDGLPRKSDYRHYVIQDASDDLTAVAEVVRRRFRRLTAESPERPGRFGYPPQLLVIDGARGQARAAAAAMAEVTDVVVPVIGLAKRMEEVWLPDSPEPVILSRTSEALYLLQRVRDEAHRFAITFHRQRRGKRALVSELDGIPGLGPARRDILTRAFPTLPDLRSAHVAEIAALPGFGPTLAARILAAIGQSSPGVNTATGEILDGGAT